MTYLKFDVWYISLCDWKKKDMEQNVLCRVLKNVVLYPKYQTAIKKVNNYISSIRIRL